MADSRSATGTEDVAGQLQQLVSVVGVLASRLERVEAASAFDTSSGSQWRPRSDTVNLGYVDHAALDRCTIKLFKSGQDLLETLVEVHRCLHQVLQLVLDLSLPILGSVDRQVGSDSLEIGLDLGVLVDMFGVRPLTLRFRLFLECRVRCKVQDQVRRRVPCQDKPQVHCKFQVSGPLPAQHRTGCRCAATAG